MRLQGGKQYLYAQWHGNDTIWRTIVDLNTAILYATEDGALDLRARARKILTIGDMLIAGEKDGPLRPAPKPLGAVLGATNGVLFDYVFCKMTGFDMGLIPTIHQAARNDALLCGGDIANVVLRSNVRDHDQKSLEALRFPPEWHFDPNPAWSEVLKRE